MSSRSLLVAMLCAAAVTAEFVGGKATRDALFLTSLHVTALPMMLIVTGLFSIVLVTVHTRTTGRMRPATLVPASFVASGLLFIFEWILRPAAPEATAVMVYLHVSGAGPLLASGFWLIVSERFDPSTAKANFGQIAGAGTIGGVLGAILSERVAAQLGTPPMLLFLGGLQFVAAWLVWVLADKERMVTPAVPAPATRAASLASGPRAIAEAPHLRHLTALVLLGTTSAALLEYLFKTRAVFTFGPGDGLLRFFALYYASTSLISFVLQVAGSTMILKRFGLGMTTSSPSIALLAGSIGGLVVPGFGSLVVARAGESILRGSWFRAGYEQFFTPMSSEEKRTAKPFIDVAIDRMGDAVGGGIVRLVVVFVPLAQYSVILSVAMVCSLGAVLAASHLNRWYLRTLEKSLVNQGGDIDLSDTRDGATARVLATFRRREARRLQGSPTSATTGSGASVITPGNPVALAARAEADDILVLRLGSRERVIEVLSKQDGLPPGLVPHVIPLLAWDSVADYAVFALRKVAEERVGELSDSMLNPAMDVAIRLRLAKVFSVCVSQRAADGLLLALDDERAAVRFQAARSLVAIVEKNPRLHIDRARIEEAVLREVALGPSLVHAFSLLSLIFPREPLQIAFRSLNSEDTRLRGTALEYLEEVLPMSIRQGLWPFLVRQPSPALVSLAPQRR